MQISEAQLSSLTQDLDDMHRATLPKMQEAIAELRSDEGASRRTFLFGAAGLTAGALVVVACGSDNNASNRASGGIVTPSSSSSSSGGSGGGLTGDLAVAALAASLENLAVQTYQAGLDAAAQGKLGMVPPAIATFATTVQMQHKDHAAAWNSILTGAGKPAVTGVDKTVQDAVVTPALANVHNVVDLAKLALQLEDVAAATYLNGIQNVLQDVAGIKVSGSIQPVEMQHSAVLHLVLGDYPIPDSFAKVDGARTPTDTIG
jgi:hypothetical protein